MAIDTKGQTSQDDLILSGKAYVIAKVTQAATVGKVSRLQLWNPANSGKIYMVAALSGWSTGSNVWQMLQTATELSGATEQSALFKNCNSQYPNGLALKCYTDATLNSASASSTFAQITVAATASQGSSILASNKNAIGQGRGLDVEITTANIALNAYVLVFEFDA